MKRVWLFVLFALFFQLSGWLLFGRGFFPSKQPLSGISSYTDRPPLIYDQREPSQQYDRMFFIVIDALRADFVYDISLGEWKGKENRMPFIQRLLDESKIIPLIGKAQAPTVTLPRVKALLSGSVPSFWDFVDNFHSPALKEDSLMHQFQSNNWKSCFYGDDTWLRLFPPEDNFFLRYEGTTSFFVADTVEVDNNVTRGLDREIQIDMDSLNGNSTHISCDAVILHYLGLDHIGHYQGPKSALLHPKLLEMDGIIEKVYNHVNLLDDKRCNGNYSECGTLIVVTGDHGMNELGNHGGSSLKEISTALMLIDPKWENISTKNYFQQVNQVDLIPSLVQLFNLSIPKNSLGTIIPSVLNLLEIDELLRAYQINANQLLHVLKGNSVFWENNTPQTEEIQTIWENYQAISEGLRISYSPKTTLDSKLHQHEVLVKEYEALVTSISKQFVILLTEYDLSKLFFGIFLLSCSCISFFICFYFVKHWFYQYTLVHIIEFMMYFSGIVLFYVSLFASSLVEEEHQTWYFLVNTFLICYIPICYFSSNENKKIVLKKSIKQIIILFIIQRLMRSWNQTGVKWVHLMDIGDVLEEVFFPYLLMISILVSILIILIYSFTIQPSNVFHSILFRLSTLFCCITLLITKFFHVDHQIILSLGLTQDIITKMIQFSYISLVIQIYLFIFYPGSKINRQSKNEFIYHILFNILILMMFLHKPKNQLLLILMILHASQLRKLYDWLNLCFDNKDTFAFCIIRVGILSYSFSKFSYFIFGNSNSLASIDIAGAYTGLDNYSEWFVGLFAGIILYTGPIIYGFVTLDYILSLNNRAQRIQFVMLLQILWGLIHSWLLLIFTCVITILREHLFIWSVFSPKFIFESMHTGYFLCNSIILFMIYFIL